MFWVSKHWRVQYFVFSFIHSTDFQCTISSSIQYSWLWRLQFQASGAHLPQMWPSGALAVLRAAVGMRSFLETQESCIFWECPTRTAQLQVLVQCSSQKEQRSPEESKCESEDRGKQVTAAWASQWSRGDLFSKADTLTSFWNVSDISTETHLLSLPCPPHHAHTHTCHGLWDWNVQDFYNLKDIRAHC